MVVEQTKIIEINNKKEMETLEDILKNLSEEERIKSMGTTLGRIICILAKYFINSRGYDVVSRVISRDIREIGKKDMEKLTNLLEIKEKTPDNLKRLTRIAGLLLGLKFKIVKGEDKETHAYIVDCPFSDAVKELHEPFICNICEEYNKGVVEFLFGPKFKLVSLKKITKGDEYCKYHITKKD